MNPMKMIQQAQQMQKAMQKVQEELGNQEVTGTAGGGAVTVTMTGKSEVRRVKISADVVDKTDIETLEDLVTAAVNDAQAKAFDLAQNEMKKVTGGMNLPF
jgi:DNA-binding YbaB/EbfC family protein